MEKQQSKPTLLAVLLTGLVAACSAGNSTSAVPARGSATFGSSVSLGRSGSPIQPATAFVDLRSAAPFAILAGSTVTNTGPTKVVGNVGLSPGSAITGFPPGVIHGRLYVADRIARQAKLDLTRAYNDAMGRTHNPIKVAGNIGGQTLYPGLYKSTSSLAISSGDLTLDARGHSDAVWVFQIASKFVMTTGRSVILTKGARARNVFWAVGSSATFGTGCSFYGSILAHQSISMATGTVMTGRALARVGAVTMQRNTIVKPGR
jgi:Ice-binding-like